MYKKRIMYRRLWYFKRRHLKHIHIYLRFMLVTIILVLCFSYANKNIFPKMVEVSESRIKSDFEYVVNKVLRDTFTEGLKYQDLAILKRDENGNVISVDINSAGINLLSYEVAELIKTELNLNIDQKVSMPLGAILGSGILSGSGPELFIKVISYNNICTEFYSEFESKGKEQTRYILYVMVRSDVEVEAPLHRQCINIEVTIPVLTQQLF